jgi:hypothetical protein
MIEVIRVFLKTCEGEVLMKMMMKSTLVAAMICGSVSLALAGESNPNAVEISGITGMSNSAGSNVLNKDSKSPDIIGDKRFTGSVIEESILKVRDDLITVKNSAEDMDYKKRNPIKGDLQNFDVGAHKDIADLMSSISAILGGDKTRFSEKDPVAKAMIPIGDTGYTLPANTEINVIGGSSIQAYPLKVGEEIIGHFRVACGGYHTDDVIVNNDSVSYCVSSIMTTGVSRDSDVHKDATTKLFFVGVSDPYMVGKVAKVKINWVNQPKSTVKGTLVSYNLDKVPYAVDTLDYNTNVTMSDGTVLAGTNAKISK